MRHHESGRSPERERGSISRRPVAPAPGDRPAPDGLIALQRTLGNAATAEWVRRSRERRRVEGESGGGSWAPGGHERAAVQRVETGAEPGADGKPVRRGDVHERERALSEKYGIRIGPPEGADGHFGPAVLDRIDAALASLPQGDLGPNEQLIAIEPDPSGNYTSSYDTEDQTISIVHPIIAGGVRAPDWLYARLNRGSRWQRKLMDRAAMSGMEGIGSKSDRALGIGRGERHVMAGVSDELAHGNLVEWTVRHEVGHAVDEMVEWNLGLAEQERFGGWRVHLDADMEDVARAVFRQAGLLAVLPATNERIAIGTLALRLGAESVREDAVGKAGWLHKYFDRFARYLEPPELDRRRDLALRFIRFALAQPWSLDDGGASVLDVGGRTYHVDQHGKWVSYSTEQRSSHALSNYQFSNPQEWFAEAYAAYYDPKSGVGDRLSPEVRAWFAARGAAAGGARSG
ncbi:hypothetical protein GCM10027271_38130 [Saccharopolyspora gloriosae]|uniref:Uncharacterized protein n=1 Tax=Saccharopolyspora gloriosae TaxID=455344 RepID=A0A840NCG2_9PSEU|nr:hypothetical protein [Saccharopolyspora gloriosae]MBB5069294.1 hypothetical protein [Saccharopolyspora gloriosae]